MLELNGRMANAMEEASSGKSGRTEELRGISISFLRSIKVSPRFRSDVGVEVGAYDRYLSYHSDFSKNYSFTGLRGGIQIGLRWTASSWIEPMFSIHPNFEWRADERESGFLEIPERKEWIQIGIRFGLCFPLYGET